VRSLPAQLGPLPMPAPARADLAVNFNARFHEEGGPVVDRCISANMLIKKQRGMTQSVLARCSDGGYYVLKFTNNPLGLNALVSEVVTARLGHFLGLPVPAYAFVDVSDRLISHTPDIVIEQGDLRLGYKAGVQFGSKTAFDSSGAAQVIGYMPASLVCWVEDLPVFAGALVLDAWLGGTDFRQVVYVKSSHSMAFRPIFIDHDRSLAPFFDPQSEGSLPASHFSEFYAFVRGWGSLEPWLTIAESAGCRELESLVTGFPPEWEVSDRLSAELLEYLLKRKNEIRTRIGLLLDGQVVRLKNWGKPWPDLWSWTMRMEARLGGQ
jgi:hypothetical protein